VDVVLQTERLLLRRFTQDDDEALYRLDSDPEVKRFIDGGDVTPMDEIQAKIRGHIEAYARHERLGTWVAIDKSSGRFLGWYALKPTKTPGEAELGYRLVREAWGRGYATEGAKALVEMGFTEAGLDRIVAQTMTVNCRSRRVMEKSGLTYQETFFGDFGDPIEGSDQGDVWYAITKAEWRDVTRSAER
jgi:RimJ/RimL family protein N-acetyltransferase